MTRSEHDANVALTPKDIPSWMRPAPVRNTDGAKKK